MKLKLGCHDCLREREPTTIEKNGTKTFKGEREDVVDVVVRDDGLYEYTCQYGHKNFTIIELVNFEVLFEIGIYAVIDGYYREAISAYSASLERAYEFFIKVICCKNNIAGDQFKRVWKLVSSQSERQLGAFILLYTIEKGERPKILSNNDTGFRNKVIHKGRIPTRDEAVRYGEKVQIILRPLLHYLQEQYPEVVTKMVDEMFTELSSKIDNDMKKMFSRTKMSTFVSLNPWMDVVGQRQPLSEYIHDINL